MSIPNDPSTALIVRLRGEFACAATEIGFRHEQAGTILRDLRRALTLCSLFYAMFSVADVLALGLQAAIPPLLARFSVPALAWAGLRYARRATVPVDAAYRVASAYTLLGMFTYMVVVWHRPADILLHGTSVGLMAVAILIFIPNRLRSAVAIALGSSLVFIALAWYQHLEPTRRLVSMTMLILFANAFGAVATAYALTGTSINIITLQLYAQIRGDALQNPGLGAAIALAMVLIAALANVIYLIVRTRAERWLK